MRLLSCIWLFATPWTVAYQAPPSMAFFQAKILEWADISFSRGSSQPKEWTWVCCIAGRRFTVWVTREALMTILNTVLKSRDNTLPTKVYIVKDTVFSVVMYRGESWTIMKAEHRRTDTFELWCSRRLRSPLDSKRSIQSILKEINPEYSLERLILKLKLQ